MSIQGLSGIGGGEGGGGGGGRGGGRGRDYKHHIQTHLTCKCPDGIVNKHGIWDVKGVLFIKVSSLKINLTPLHTTLVPSHKYLPQIPPLY